MLNLQNFKDTRVLDTEGHQGEQNLILIYFLTGVMEYTLLQIKRYAQSTTIRLRSVATLS